MIRRSNGELNEELGLGRERSQKLVSYEDFFLSQVGERMVLYEDFPGLEMIVDYYLEKSWVAEHPIFEYGKFNVKELAVLIKLLGYFYQGKDYKILTFGGLERIRFAVKEGTFEELRPRLFCLVGTESALKEYMEYRNSFLGDEVSFNLEKKIPHLFVLQPQEASVIDTLGIPCYDLCSNSNWYSGGIYYYDYLKDEYFNKKYLGTFNLFDVYFFRKVNSYQGIEDTLSFLVHSEDVIIAKALISIAIYKKKLQKSSFVNEDYQQLFYELFQDNSIQMKKLVERNFPKKLKYVRKKDES